LTEISSVVLYKEIKETCGSFLIDSLHSNLTLLVYETTMKALTSYLQNVRAELQHVVWPAPRRAITDVIAIVLISAIVALIITGLDYAFTGAVNYIVSNGI
jgi:preprotein translocase SecE subunit